MPDTDDHSERVKVRKDARRTAKRAERAFSPDEIAPTPFAGTMQFSTNAMRHWMETSQDMARFYNGRFKKDFTYLTEMASCRTPRDLTALWCRAASEAAHDYADQLDRVMELNVKNSSGEPAPAAE